MTTPLQPQRRVPAGLDLSPSRPILHRHNALGTVATMPSPDGIDVYAHGLQMSPIPMTPLTPFSIHSDQALLSPSVAGPLQTYMQTMPSIAAQTMEENQDLQAMMLGVTEALRIEAETGTHPVVRMQLRQILGDKKTTIEADTREYLANEGDRKSWRALIYFMVALVGRVGVGMGSTMLEREVLPIPPPGQNPGPSGPPGVGNVPNTKYIAGSFTLGLGVLLGVTASALFYAQARKKRPTRALALLSIHLSAIGCVITHHFISEYVDRSNAPVAAKVGAALGIIGSGLYAYTVPNSLTAAEMQCGRIPLGSVVARTEAAVVSSALAVALFSAWGFSTQIRMTTLSKEAIFISAMVFQFFSASLPFTNNRNYQNQVSRGLERIAKLQAQQMRGSGSNASQDERRSSEHRVSGFRRPSVAASLAARRNSTATFASSDRGHRLSRDSEGFKRLAEERNTFDQPDVELGHADPGPSQPRMRPTKPSRMLSDVNELSPGLSEHGPRAAGLEPVSPIEPSNYFNINYRMG